MQPTSEQVQAVQSAVADWLGDYINTAFVHTAMAELPMFADTDDNTFVKLVEAFVNGKWTVAVTWEADDAE